MPLNIDQAKQEGFELGLEHGPMDHDSLYNFEQSDVYANTILPKLRQIAGYEDSGVGTYQISQEICATADDLNGTMETTSAHIMDRVIEGWIDGVTHGVEVEC